LRPYDKQEDIPEALREHYSRREDGKYHADIPNDHPAVKHNATLLSEKQTAEEKARAAEANLASANVLPRGHVAVPSAKAALLEQYEPLGAPDELKTIKAEHGTLKTESEAAKRDKHLREVAKVLGYEPEAFIRLQNLPEFELRDGTEKDSQGNPKKIAVAKIKGADNVVTEKPGKEFIESHEDYKPFMAALKPAQGAKDFAG
jgi:hypothetical protein